MLTEKISASSKIMCPCTYVFVPQCTRLVYAIGSLSTLESTIRAVAH